MKSTTLFTLIISLLLALGCASGSKIQATPAEMAALDQIVADGHYAIKASWAKPMASRGLNSIANAGLLPPGSSAGRIDIAGSGAHLTIKKDSVVADLPYFGERHMGGGYDPDNAGIKFEGVPEDYSLGPIKKGDGYSMEFHIRDGQETYRVSAQIYGSRMATISVASSHRNTIWYQGRLVETKGESGP